MTGSDAPHGTSKRYDHGTRTTAPCRCDLCRAAKSRAKKRSNVRVLAGQGVMIDAAPARAHVEALLDAGLTMKHIARLSGVASTSIRILLGRDSTRPAGRRIARHNAARLLAVRAGRFADDPAADDAPTTWVPITGSTRRLQAMVASGRLLTDIAAELGVNHSVVHRIVYATKPRMHLSIAREITALSRRWSEQLPPQRTAAERSRVAKAKRLAAQHGWMPFGAWADIDDPAAVPEVDQPRDLPADRDGDFHIVDAVLAERVTWAQLRPADRHVLVRWGIRNGWSRAEIAERAKVDSDALGYYMSEAKAAG